MESPVHGDRRAGEAEGEPRPHADTTEARGEAEDIGARRADHPVADDGHDHRNARVLEPAQQARARHLQAVEDLERRRHGKKRHRDARDLQRKRVIAVEEEADERTGQQPEQQRACDGDRGRHGDHRAGRPVEIFEIVAAMRLAHPDGSGLRQPQRNHERDRGELDRDAVGRKAHRAEPAHHHRRHHEQAYFGDDRRRDRDAEPHHFEERLPVRPPQPDEEFVGAEGRARVCPDREKREDQHGRAERRDRRADDTQPRRAEMAEDEGVVEHDIGDDPRKHRPQDHLCPADRGEEGAQPHRKERRKQAPLHDVLIGAGKPRKLRLLPERKQDRLRMPQHEHHRHGIDRRHPQSHPHRAAHRPRVAAAEGVRCERNDRIREADAEDEEKEEGLRAEDAGGQFARAEPAQHDDVGRPDRRLGELRADQRQAEQGRRAQMRRPGLDAAVAACPVVDDAFSHVLRSHARSRMGYRGFGDHTWMTDREERRGAKGPIAGRPAEEAAVRTGLMRILAGEFNPKRARWMKHGDKLRQQRRPAEENAVASHRGPACFKRRRGSAGLRSVR